MEIVKKIIDIALHLDRYLSAVIQQYGIWTYAILFAVIFIETGFVVMPFLPGDSLLFAAGTFAALKALKIGWLILGLSVAAILGDTVNYWIGHRIGPKVFCKDDARFFKKEYLDRTHAFYEKHGGKTIIIARFVPIIRSFAPFVAGVGRMSYGRFLAFNVIGGISWVLLLTGAGYFFGTIPFVKENYSVAVLAIIAISTVPIAVEYLRHRKGKRPAPPSCPDSVPHN
ncbi:MAG: DedA family protein [Candidatus Aminicenantes bacterium]|nr:MAG: DedA family protein [Candidatus Aminicenantes bacterium]